jgi:hypothetical protein
VGGKASHSPHKSEKSDSLSEPATSFVVSGLRAEVKQRSFPKTYLQQSLGYEPLAEMD